MIRKLINKYNKYDRIYYVIKHDLTETLKNYNENIKKGFDNLIYLHPFSEYVRIISYNVRYFTSADNRPTIKYIVDTILTYNPHVVLLQEISLGNNKYYNTSELRLIFVNELNRLFHYYEVISICSSPPSYYTTMYGNMVLVHKNYLNNILNIRNNKYASIVKDILCDISAARENRCFLNQQTFTYGDVPGKEIREFADVGKIEYQEKTNENKCFIKISLPQFDLICVHLDAYNSNDRIKQINEINAKITRRTIIMGDFNFFNIEDFLYWKNLLLSRILVQIIFDQNVKYKLSDLNKKIMDDYRNIINDELRKTLAGDKNDIKNDIANIIIGNITLQMNDISEQIKELYERTNMSDAKYDMLSDKLFDRINIKYNMQLKFDQISIDNFSISNEFIKKILDRINEIDIYLNSLNEYFLTRSGSIYENKEFNYCTLTLNWKTINPKDTINFSQWSGTRVDNVFFANFDTNIKFDNYYEFIPIDHGSDHLPMILDFYVDDIILHDSLGIPFIDLSAIVTPYISTNIPSNILSESKSITNPCDKYKPMTKVKPDESNGLKSKFENPLYNAQPIAIKSFDWIINGKFNNTSDPFVTTGTSDLILGRLGVYLTTSLSYTGNIGYVLSSQHLKNMKKDPSGIYHGFLMWEFKYIGPNLDTINIGAKGLNSDLAHKECYDNEFDIICVDDSLGNHIFKIPERNVQNYLKLKSLYICTNIINSRDYAWKYYPVINQYNYKISDTLLTVLRDTIISEEPSLINDDGLNKKISMDILILINSIYKINEFSASVYHTNFIPIIDENRFKILWEKLEDGHVTYTMMCYDIDLGHYAPQLIGGHVDIYHMYKHDYLLLKSNIYNNYS